VPLGPHANRGAAVAPPGLQLLSFEVCDQAYAIALEHVQEIVRMPERVVQIPQAKAPALGLIALRNALLPLMSMRQMLGLPGKEWTDGDRAIVLRLGTLRLGIVVDSVKEVLGAAASQLDEVPRLLAGHDSAARIGQICRLEGDERLIAILSGAALMQQFGEAANMVVRPNEREREAASEGREEQARLLVFRLGGVEFALRLDAVQEIVLWSGNITFIPRAPDYIEGVVNLRGTVLPLIDLRRHLALPEQQDRASQRILVVRIEEKRVGLIVDRAIQVLSVPSRMIVMAPLLAGRASNVLTHIVNLQPEHRMLQLIGLSQLIEQRSRHELSYRAAS
jgi:purine-binding chemotaxis protein CheW